MFYIPRWARVQRADDTSVKRLVNAMLALGVSLQSSDYITKVDLKTFELVLVDDDEDASFPSMVSTPSAMAPLGPAAGVVLPLAPAPSRAFRFLKVSLAC